MDYCLGEDLNALECHVQLLLHELLDAALEFPDVANHHDWQQHVNQRVHQDEPLVEHPGVEHVGELEFDFLLHSVPHGLLVELALHVVLGELPLQALLKN